jgi:hypothetical protein
MTKTTNAYHTYTVCWRHFIVVECGKYRGASTHQWTGIFGLNAFWHLVAESRIKDSMMSKTAQSYRKSDSFGAQYLVARRALFTVQASPLEVAKADNRASEIWAFNR